MDNCSDTWDAAVEATCIGKARSTARRRRLSARRFVEWCAEHGHDPRTAAAATVRGYIASLPTDDPQAPLNVACDLRMVLRAVDPVASARTLGLGNRSEVLKELAGTPLGALVQDVIDRFRQPAHRAVRKSALARLFVWAAEVGISPIAVTATDLGQFWAWLVAVGAGSPQTKVVAKDFVELRHSAVGRAILGEPEPVARPLKIADPRPLRPRFALADVPRLDPLSDVPAPVSFRSVVPSAADAPRGLGPAVPRTALAGSARAGARRRNVAEVRPCGFQDRRFQPLSHPSVNGEDGF